MYQLLFLALVVVALGLWASGKQAEREAAKIHLQAIGLEKREKELAGQRAELEARCREQERISLLEKAQVAADREQSERHREHELAAQRAEFEARCHEQERILSLEKAQVAADREHNQRDREAVEHLAREKTKGLPWLANAYAEYLHLKDLQTARHLEHKEHPARRAAEQVREIAKMRRVAEELYRTLRYQLQYYEGLFPWLVDFKDEDVEDLIAQLLEGRTEEDAERHEQLDPAQKWLTQAEYANLSTTERNQLALNRYWQKKKSRWEIGRDYERYVGHIFESRGYEVDYRGIVEGLEDLGRDLIARKGPNVEVVQCKCWSRHKTIHEKHIFQLFGTTVEYWLAREQSTKDPRQPALFSTMLYSSVVAASFYTSTTLSPKARQFAEALRVTVMEEFPLKPYPSVKCNVSRRTGEKIYHLPFDQQYDHTLIEGERNERYVKTVAEAEALGFRRAFRWSGAGGKVAGKD